MSSYIKLQNGSDIRGIALSGVEGEIPNLCKEDAEKIAKGFLAWLCEYAGKDPNEIVISIGRDPRLSGKTLLDGFVKGLKPYGVVVYDCGLASTPAMFMSTKFEQYSCDAAVMITASHLPYNRNGFKFFTEDGGLNKTEIKEILKNAEISDDFFSAYNNIEHDVVEKKLMDDYSKHLRRIIVDGIFREEKRDLDYDAEKPLLGMNIVVDAGNGAGGFYAKSVLAPLGADVSNSQFLTPDGTFPNHPPNPENKEAMESICTKVISSKADLGIIFDTDVDRSAAVDRKGRPIGRNEIVALAAALVSEECPETTVVTDSITSDQLTKFIEEELGLKHLRYKRGYKNVIDKAIELNEEGVDSRLAIETSGHAAFKENYFLDDGAYLATKIVIEAAKLSKLDKGIDTLIEGLERPEESVEYRIKINRDEFAEYAKELFDDILDWAIREEGVAVVSPNFEGVRINFDKNNGNGWCLIRMSLHDPLLPLNVESNEKDGCKKIISKLKPILEEYKDLETGLL